MTFNTKGVKWISVDEANLVTHVCNTIVKPVCVIIMYLPLQNGALTQKEFIQWSMDHTDLSMQLANILFEVHQC